MSNPAPREASAVHPNRRKNIRLTPRTGVSCAIRLDGAGETVYAAEILDVSQAGLRLLAPRRHEPGAFLHITLTNSAELFSYSAVVVVRYAVGAADGGNITGCEFLQPLTYDQLRALLA
jgi:hypothetical protein